MAGQSCAVDGLSTCAVFAGSRRRRTVAARSGEAAARHTRGEVGLILRGGHQRHHDARPADRQRAGLSGRLLRQRRGLCLDGGVDYTLEIPRDAPAEAFWPLTVYDVSTRCIIINETKQADRSSRMDLLEDHDGSVTLYIGPKKPEGDKATNSIQTMHGKAWFPYFRLYSPQKAFLDKSWILPDIEKLYPSIHRANGSTSMRNTLFTFTVCATAIALCPILSLAQERSFDTRIGTLTFDQRDTPTESTSPNSLSAS